MTRDSRQSLKPSKLFTLHCMSLNFQSYLVSGNQCDRRHPSAKLPHSCLYLALLPLQLVLTLGQTGHLLPPIILGGMSRPPEGSEFTGSLRCSSRSRVCRLSGQGGYSDSRFRETIGGESRNREIPTSSFPVGVAAP